MPVECVGRLRQWVENQLSGDGDGGLEGAVDGALVGEEAVNPLRGLPVLAVGFQFERGVDAADDEDVILSFDFADGLRDQAGIGRINLTRFQRASEGAGESTSSGGDDVVEGRGVGVEDLRGDLIMLGDRAVHAEQNGCRLGGQPGPAQRAFEAFNLDVRAIDDVGH